MEEAYEEIMLLKKQLRKDPTNKFIIDEIQYIQDWISEQLKMDSKSSEKKDDK